MKFKLYKIGVEIEFNVGDFQTYINQIRNELYPNTENANDIPILHDFLKMPEWVEAQLDKEYYKSQCEWKIKPLTMTIDSIWKIKSFFLNRMNWIVWVIRKTIFKTICHDESPQYVWTHIHLFFNCDWFKGERFFRGKTFLAKFLFEYFYLYFKENKYSIPKEIILKELERLVSNHNILQRFDYHTLNKRLRANLNDNWIDYYHKNLDKIKYQPVFWSAPKPGKPLTLELRYIPNSFFVYTPWKDIHEFLTLIEKIINYVNNLTSDEFKTIHESNKEDCVNAHSNLIDLYKEYCSDWSKNPFPKYDNNWPKMSNSIPTIKNHKAEYTNYRMKHPINHHKACYNSTSNVNDSYKKLIEHKFNNGKFDITDNKEFYSLIEQWSFSKEIKTNKNSLWNAYICSYITNYKFPKNNLYTNMIDYFNNLLNLFKTIKDSKIVVQDKNFLWVDQFWWRIQSKALIIDWIEFDNEGNELSGSNNRPIFSLSNNIIDYKFNYLCDLITNIPYRWNNFLSEITFDKNLFDKVVAHEASKRINTDTQPAILQPETETIIF